MLKIGRMNWCKHSIVAQFLKIPLRGLDPGSGALLLQCERYECEHWTHALALVFKHLVVS